MTTRRKYNLDILEWQQFEALSFRCLQKDISPSVQHLEGGNDKGRDIIFTGATNFFQKSGSVNKYIFQVKHKSGNKPFNSLKVDLKNELIKVFITNKLRFNCYCLVTNLTINANQFDELNTVFNLFIREFNPKQSILFYIYSYRHFESCIDRNESIKWVFPLIISQADFKLLLDDLINRRQRNLSRGWLNIFKKNKDRFILTNIYDEAIEKLNKNNILLLSGPPKSGKTFNAEMIILNSVFENNYTPLKIEKVEDFEKFFDPNKKQFFLFDDAYGKHNIDLYRADVLDRKLEFIFECIDANHKCIFTSREYIYNAFLQYSDADDKKLIDKVSVEVSKLSISEKESIFRRYFKYTFPSEKIIDDQTIKLIVEHKNFSPETVRAYFDYSTSFDLVAFKKHLDLPDKYLEKVFTNLNQDKRIVLLSILFALDEDEPNISYTFNNICEDLNYDHLTSLKDELHILKGSIISGNEDKYYFYHPSMFDFFVNYLDNDSASYRKLLYRNVNLNLLAISKFKSDILYPKNIEIRVTDTQNLSIGFRRLISNPHINLFEINSLFVWINNPDVQLYFKVNLNQKFRLFLDQFYQSLSNLDFSKFFNEDIYYLSTFFYHLIFLFDATSKSNFISEETIRKLLIKRKNDKIYWLLIFRVMPFLEKNFIYDHIGRDWLNGFYHQLKNEINTLGYELLGNSYPNFKEIKLYKKLMDQKRFEEAGKLKKKSVADYKQKTNRYWYPRYRLCKEKMTVLKSSHPYGYTIYKKLIGNFEHLKLLEDNQKNRYIFNKQKNWW